MENLPKKIRSKKLNARVDLTAMVSVSFLLVIFFMVTIELAKPKMMDLSLPENRTGVFCPEGENRSITIMLGKNNKLIFYKGILSSPIIPPKNLQYGENGIRRELQKINKNMLEVSAKIGRRESIIVIIKPSKKSNFKNLVDILDEMAIASIGTYAIVPEFTPEESKLLASK